MITPYRDIPALVEQRAPFRGNSMHGGVDHEGNYIVWSYDTIIGWDFGHGLKVRDDHFSVTTSRQQTMLRRCGAVDVAMDEAWPKRKEQ